MFAHLPAPRRKEEKLEDYVNLCVEAVKQEGVEVRVPISLTSEHKMFTEKLEKVQEKFVFNEVYSRMGKSEVGELIKRLVKLVHSVFLKRVRQQASGMLSSVISDLVFQENRFIHESL